MHLDDRKIRVPTLLFMTATPHILFPSDVRRLDAYCCPSLIAYSLVPTSQRSALGKPCICSEVMPHQQPRTTRSEAFKEAKMFSHKTDQGCES